MNSSDSEVRVLHQLGSVCFAASPLLVHPLKKSRLPRSRCRTLSRVSKPHLQPQLHIVAPLPYHRLAPCYVLRPSLHVWAALLLCLPRVWLASAALLFLCCSLTHRTSPHPKRFCSTRVSDSYSWGQRYYYPCSRLTSKDKEHGCRDGAVHEGDDAQSGCAACDKVFEDHISLQR